MIRFWRNATEDDPVEAADRAVSYITGFILILLCLASLTLNTISFRYQCLHKATTSRRLFKLLAVTDLLTSLYYPLYAVHMCFRAHVLPQLAMVGVVEAVFIKLVSIPIYLSVVVTSLLSISRYLGVRDPLSVKRGDVGKSFRRLFSVLVCYLAALIVTLVYIFTKSHTTLHRGAGLTVYFWDARVLVQEGNAGDEHQHVLSLTLLNLLLWVPAILHCIAGFVTSIRTILLLNGRKRRLSQVHASASPHSPVLRDNRRKLGNQDIITSPTLLHYVKSTVHATSSTSTISPSLLNNKRGAITIFLMNIGNIVWFANFLTVVLFEVRKDQFGFVYLDTARFFGRLFIPQLLAALNPLIVVSRSSGVRDYFKYYSTTMAARLGLSPKKI